MISHSPLLSCAAVSKLIIILVFNDVWLKKAPLNWTFANRRIKWRTITAHVHYSQIRAPPPYSCHQCTLKKKTSKDTFNNPISEPEAKNLSSQRKLIATNIILMSGCSFRSCWAHESLAMLTLIVQPSGSVCVISQSFLLFPSAFMI